MTAKRHFWHFAMFFFFSAHLKQLYQGVCHGFAFFANLAKMLTSAKKLLTSATFFHHVFLRFRPFRVFLSLLIQQSFWSKIAEVSSAYIRVYSFSLSF